MDDIAEAANECICPHGPFAKRALEDTSPRYQRLGNPTACFDSCRQSFFHLVTGFPNVDIGNVPPFQEFCSKVTGHQFSPQFWQLYWCDTAFCGLWLPPNKTGEDPNVDRIINRCANFGYSSIFDPGPPPSTFSCNGLPTDGPGAPCPNHTYMLPAGATIGVSPTTPAMAMASTTGMADVTDTAGASISFRTPTPSSSSAQEESVADTSHKTSAGLLAAVVVCVVAGVLVLAALLLFLIRRRRKNNRQDPVWANNGPMQTIDGPDGRPLPQAYTFHSRGRSRLFRSKGSGGRSASPPLTSLSPPPSPTVLAAAAAASAVTAPPIPYYFPSSPICAPTTNKLEPRRETSTTTTTTTTTMSAAVPTWAGRHSTREKNWSQETAVSPVSLSPTSPRSPQPTALSLPPVAASKLHGSSDSEVSCGSVSVSSSLASSLYGHALTTDGEVAAAAATAMAPSRNPARLPEAGAWPGEQGRVVVYVRPVMEG